MRILPFILYSRGSKVVRTKHPLFYYQQKRSVLFAAFHRKCRSFSPSTHLPLHCPSHHRISKPSIMCAKSILDWVVCVCAYSCGNYARFAYGKRWATAKKWRAVAYNMPDTASRQIVRGLSPLSPWHRSISILLCVCVRVLEVQTATRT